MDSGSTTAGRWTRYAEASSTLTDRNDLRALEESIRRDAERVDELEQEKIGLDPAHPQVGQISHRVERIAAELKEKAVAERRLAEEA